MRSFRKKIKNVNHKKTDRKDKDNETVSINTRPRVCCIDIKKDTEDGLKKNGLNVYSGTLGSKIVLPNTSRYDNHQILLNFDFPVNLHEYDILIIDLDNFTTIDYKKEDHIRDNHTGKSAISLLSTYPETMFDPRPLSSFILQKKLKQIGDKPFMVLVFTTNKYSVEYEPIKIFEDRVLRQEIENHNIYSFLTNIPLSSQKIGKEITICDIREDLKNLFKSLTPIITYKQTFFHPKGYTNGEYVPQSDWFPLLKNANNEIVSILHYSNKQFIYFLPQFKTKTKFLCDFLSKIAPDILPDLFPFSTTFSWKNHKDYFLPNHEKLLGEKKLIENEYKKKLYEISNKIDSNKEEYSFLHKILTESGDGLTQSLIKFFKWLGFKDVIDLDDQKTDTNLYEEDIQIKLVNGLLIIECKGMGGTSTDSDCSQISKIKHRRCKERDKFDVHALYIVNHQRYLPPLDRINPPFNSNQIQDAVYDERSLVSTWQLYNLYFMVERGIITKEEAQKALLSDGLVDFKPQNLIFIDEPKEILKNGTVCIVNINNIELNVGDELIVERNGQYQKVVLKSIRINDKPLNKADSGEIGLSTTLPIKKKSKLWKRVNSY